MAEADPAVVAHDRHHLAYLSTRVKFVVSLLVAIAWTTLAIYLARPWMSDLTALTSFWFSVTVISFIAFIPGFMFAFLFTSLLLDRRPRHGLLGRYPGLTVLVAAYQEEDSISEMLDSLLASDYPGELQILVINDGSRDATATIVRDMIAKADMPADREFNLLDFEINRGKSEALNSGLAEAHHDLIATVDADCHLRPDSLRNIVQRMLADPPNTQAVAGAVLVKNSGESLMTAAQQWDYFHGIAAVKRMQSLYHGTLVAQGAFSLYRKSALIEVGGWPDTVGEDIVLTWAMLKKGYRIGYAEDAIVLTIAPATFKQFARQRQRWARGMIEALEQHQGILFKPRLTTLFNWWNLLFLPLDLVFSLVFIPGLIAAMFGYFWIAGPMTLALLPLAGLSNILIYRIQSRMLKREQMEMEPEYLGFVFYVFVYALIMQPICVWGYFAELTRQRKNWGTK